MLVGLHLLLIGIAFGDYGNSNLEIKLALFAIGIVAALALQKFAGITGRVSHRALVEAFETGAKYALAVGAAAATVGIVGFLLK